MISSLYFIAAFLAQTPRVCGQYNEKNFEISFNKKDCLSENRIILYGLRVAGTTLLEYFCCVKSMKVLTSHEVRQCFYGFIILEKK